APLPGLPMPRGVRTASMMYASGMRFPFVSDVLLRLTRSDLPTIPVRVPLRNEIGRQRCGVTESGSAIELR
ncbi:hypothetical protein, partial [Klebsiella aerogenes]|uniref:hypothetical protein n=1 Tax=Klebsiella aerogenes TaxID=548 RepID=UPI001953865E